MCVNICISACVVGLVSDCCDRCGEFTWSPEPRAAELVSE